MAMRDFLESEVAIAVAATAALSSARVRRVLRRGAVYGLAGVLTAGDAIAAAARDAQQAGAPGSTGAEGATERPQARPEAGNGTPGELLRRGAASGLARVLIAGDALASTARSVGRDARQAAGSVAQETRERAQAGTQAPGAPAQAGTERESDTPSSGVTPDA